MSQKGSYKKITVSSHTDSLSPREEDEEVIYVGASSSAHNYPKPPSPFFESVSTEESDGSNAPDENTEKMSDEAYHEQTLDDLNNVDVPFQKTQRIVLIVMGLLVIAFCVYWFGLR